MAPQHGVEFGWRCRAIYFRLTPSEKCEIGALQQKDLHHHGFLSFRTYEPRCAVPECRGIIHADATFREALWDRFFTAAPRPRTPSELLYSDRRLRSKSSPAATILIRKR